MAENKTGVFLGGIVLGAMMGTVTGLLVAPKSGKETRRVLKKVADSLPDLIEDLSTSLQLQADQLSDTALQNWEGTLTRLRSALVAGQAATQQEIEMLTRESHAGIEESTPERD